MSSNVYTVKGWLNTVAQPIGLDDVVGSWQLAVDSWQWTVGSGQWRGEKIRELAVKYCLLI